MACLGIERVPQYGGEDIAMYRRGVQMIRGEQACGQSEQDRVSGCSEGRGGRGLEPNVLRWKMGDCGWGIEHVEFQDF